MSRATVRQPLSSTRHRLRVLALENRITPSTIFVDDDGHNADFTTIQAAVDAAESGDRILVAKGTYREQVVIPATLDDLELKAVGRAVIAAPETFADPSRAMVHVAGGDDFEIHGFTIDGLNGKVGANYGILVDGDGSAEIEHNRISNVRDNPLTGRQEGVAIQFGQRVDGGPGSGSASHNKITDYQKGGIVVIGDGSSAGVSHNSVVGVGETGIIAQNGIQISDGATARIEFNRVSGNLFTGPDFQSVGILVFDTSDVQIRLNSVSDNDTGILLFGDAETVSDVTVELNNATHNTFDGIGLFNVADSTVRLNHASRNGEDGINLEASTGVSVLWNLAFFNGQHGIALEADATGNTIRGNKMNHNGEFDAFDASTGTGTAGTGNRWSRNHFDTSNPEDLE